jgi:crotonobetainyl-CoA:carnitine CoA-transferase CaiB-like acyl-CoA transferase
MGEEIPCSRVHRIADVAEDPQIVQRRLFTAARDETGERFVTVRSLFDGPDASPRSVPALGRHTRDVLASLGLDDADIDGIIAPDRAAATPAPPR